MIQREGTDSGESNFGQSIFGHRCFGPANLGQNQFWSIPFWPIHFWILCVSWPEGGAQTQKKSGSKGGAPKGWGPKISRPSYSPLAPGPPGLHTTAREPHTCKFWGSRLSRTQPEFNEKTPERKKKAKFWAVQGKGSNMTKPTLKQTPTRETVLHETVKQVPTPHNTIHNTTPHNTPHHTTHNKPKSVWPKSVWPKSVLAKVGHTTKTLPLAKLGLAKLGWPKGLAKVGLAKVDHDWQSENQQSWREQWIQEDDEKSTRSSSRRRKVDENGGQMKFTVYQFYSRSNVAIVNRDLIWSLVHPNPQNEYSSFRQRYQVVVLLFFAEVNVIFFHHRIISVSCRVRLKCGKIISWSHRLMSYKVILIPCFETYDTFRQRGIFSAIFSVSIQIKTRELMILRSKRCRQETETHRYLKSVKIRRLRDDRGESYQVRVFKTKWDIRDLVTR